MSVVTMKLVSKHNACVSFKKRLFTEYVKIFYMHAFCYHSIYLKVFLSHNK